MTPTPARNLRPEIAIKEPVSPENDKSEELTNDEVLKGPSRLNLKPSDVPTPQSPDIKTIKKEASSKPGDLIKKEIQLRIEGQ